MTSGVSVLYVNLTHIFGENVTITEARYDESKVIRTATVAQKFKLITLLLHSNVSDTLIGFSLDGHRANNTPVNVEFNLTVNTIPISERGLIVVKEDEDVDVEEVINEDDDETFHVLFHDIEEAKRGPKVPKFLGPPVDLLDTDFENPNEAVAEKLAELEKKLADGNSNINAQFLQSLLSQPGNISKCSFFSDSNAELFEV